MTSLVRPVSGRMIAGVCAALAKRFGWSVGLVRVLAIVSLLLPGPQILIYIVMWIVIPGEDRAARARSVP